MGVGGTERNLAYRSLRIAEVRGHFDRGALGGSVQ